MNIKRLEHESVRVGSIKSNINKTCTDEVTTNTLAHTHTFISIVPINIVVYFICSFIHLHSIV